MRKDRWLAAVFALTLPLAATVYGQGRTDVVSLANGDRLTGEVVALDRGRLEFKTDDAGTLYLEWDKLVSVVSNRVVEVVTGRRAEVCRQPRPGAQPLHRGRRALGRGVPPDARRDAHQADRRQLLASGSMARSMPDSTTPVRAASRNSI